MASEHLRRVCPLLDSLPHFMAGGQLAVAGGQLGGKRAFGQPSRPAEHGSLRAEQLAFSIHFDKKNQFHPPTSALLFFESDGLWTLFSE